MKLIYLTEWEAAEDLPEHLRGRYHELNIMSAGADMAVAGGWVDPDGIAYYCEPYNGDHAEISRFVLHKKFGMDVKGSAALYRALFDRGWIRFIHEILPAVDQTLVAVSGYNKRKVDSVLRAIKQNATEARVSYLSPGGGEVSFLLKTPAEINAHLSGAPLPQARYVSKPPTVPTMDPRSKRAPALPPAHPQTPPPSRIDPRWALRREGD